MFREGELDLRLGVRAGRIRSVGIRSTRTALPPSLTRGRPADEVARAMPLLFSICARAQGAAAAGALDAARGRPFDDAGLALRNDEVRREATVELLTRLLLDWPRVLGAAGNLKALARARQAAPGQGLAVNREIAREHVYGIEPERWLAEPTLDALDRWTAATPTVPAQGLARLRREADGLGCSDVRPMPEADVDDIAHMLPALDAAPAFGQSPDWLGRPVETGALARRAQHPLVSAFLECDGNSIAARFVAQLVDLALLLAPGGGTALVRQHSTGDGTGIGLAQTARGLLLHQARVAADGRVEQYRVVAPTEWNFHPDGALPHGLLGRLVADDDAARRDATLLAQALDPCVAFTVEVADA